MSSDSLEKHPLVLFIGYSVGIPLCGAIFYWYNHVYVQWPVKYWQWCVLAAVFMGITAMCSEDVQKMFKFLVSIIFAGAAISQVLEWMSVISLPLFK